MAKLWTQSGIPHKGWIIEDVIDIREDGESEDDTDYEKCMMCGNEKIRYVHILTHPEVAEEYRVGCICAEKMSGDYVNPKQREKEIRNKANRRANWHKKEWRLSGSGNRFLKLDGWLLVIFRDAKTGQFKLKIGETYGKKSFDTFAEAKIAAFQGVEYFKEKGKW